MKRKVVALTSLATLSVATGVVVAVAISGPKRFEVSSDNVIEAAKQLGLQDPYYHEGLVVAKRDATCTVIFMLPKGDKTELSGNGQLVVFQVNATLELVEKNGKASFTPSQSQRLMQEIENNCTKATRT